MNHEGTIDTVSIWHHILTNHVTNCFDLAHFLSTGPGTIHCHETGPGPRTSTILLWRGSTTFWASVLLIQAATLAEACPVESLSLAPFPAKKMFLLLCPCFLRFLACFAF